MSYILNNKEILVDETFFDKTDFQYSFFNQTFASILNIEINDIKNILLIKDAVIENDLLISEENDLEQLNKVNFTHIFTGLSDYNEKINLKINTNSILLSYDIDVEQLSDFYNLIEPNIIFLNKHECIHNLTKNDINLYINMSYQLLDDIMILLSLKKNLLE